MKEILRSKIAKIIVAGWSVALVFGSISVILGATNAQAQAQAGRANPYPYGKSTYWAWQNRPDLPANLGEAKAWNDSARSQGWPVSEYPRWGDVVVLEPGVLGADPRVGQVAVVEQVLQDGSYTASQMDDKDCPVAGQATCGRINHKSYTITAGSSFIHYQKDSRTTWGFSSGQSGWAVGRDLLPGNMGGPGWYYPVAGQDPQLVSPELDVPLDSAYNAVEVDMVTGIPVTDPTVQVYFATQDQPNFSEERSAKVKGQANGELQTYQFYFGSNPAWKGKLVRLRLDPTGGGTTGGVRIDRVRLAQLDTTSQPYSALSDIANDHGGRRR